MTNNNNKAIQNTHLLYPSVRMSIYFKNPTIADLFCLAIEE